MESIWKLAVLTLDVFEYIYSFVIVSISYIVLANFLLLLSNVCLFWGLLFLESSIIYFALCSNPENSSAIDILQSSSYPSD